MRHIFGISLFLFLSLGFSTLSHAGAQGFHLNGITNNITTSFSASSPFRMSFLHGNTRSLFIGNGCTTALAVTFSAYGSPTPSSNTTTNPQQIFIGPSSSATFQGLGSGNFVWVRSDTNTCLSGDVTIDAW